MKALRTVTSLALVVIAIAGCGGGTHITTVDKTLIHSSGTLNLGQVRSTSGKLEVRATGSDWQDMTYAKKKDLETWFKGKSAVEARSTLVFDDFQMPLDGGPCEKAGQLTDMQDHLHKRLAEVQDFMKNEKRQLDARKW